MSAVSAGDVDLEFDVRTEWGDGFVADLSLEASGALTGWRIEFDFSGEIASIWNARIVSRAGDRYVIEAESYNAAIAAGGSAGFGFVGTGASSGLDLTSVAINGVPGETDGGGTTPPPAPPAAPKVSVGDAQAAEEDGAITFPITLSSPRFEDVVVRYETTDGSAAAGADFATASGEVTIPAGQTEAIVRIALVDDDASEPVEAFGLRLTGVEGAEIADATAVGRIRDGDPADSAPSPAPVATGATVADAFSIEGDPAPASPDGSSGGGNGGPAAAAGSLIADGPLSTSGTQIVDANGDPVQIRAVNWFGAEGQLFAPHGLWARDLEEMMDQMVDEGFNAIRLPFSVEGILENPVVSGVEANVDLRGLRALDVLDRVVAKAEENGVKIFLDNHLASAGSGASANGLWYDDRYSEADWIDAWRILAERYGDSDAVIGADLHNEPHNAATWGGGGATDWAAAAERAGDAVHEVAPDWLIIVEGVGAHNGGSYWWGGNLQGVRDRPIELAIPDKVVYSPHDYPASVFDQPWFNDGSDLFEVFRENWGYVFEDGIGPVLLGEFGSRLENPADLPWAEAITAYLGGDFDGDGASDLADGQFGPSFAWWSWNPNSGDTGGILLDDWTTVRENAADLLAPLLDGPATLGGEGDNGGGSDAPPVDAPPVDAPEPNVIAFEIELEEPAATETTFSYATRDGDAAAGEDYEAASGVIVFAPGERSKTVEIAIAPDLEPEADEAFSLILTSTDGEEIAATGVIIDDDGTPPNDGGGGDGGDQGGGDPTPPKDGGDNGGDNGGDDGGGGGGSAALDAALRVANDWGGGATIELMITNNGETAVDDWRIAFDFAPGISNIWNGAESDLSDGRIEIDSLSYNARIEAGASTMVGFTVDRGRLDEANLNAIADFDFF